VEVGAERKARSDKKKLLFLYAPLLCAYAFGRAVWNSFIRLPRVPTLGYFHSCRIGGTLFAARKLAHSAGAQVGSPANADFAAAGVEARSPKQAPLLSAVADSGGRSGAQSAQRQNPMHFSKALRVGSARAFGRAVWNCLIPSTQGSLTAVTLGIFSRAGYPALYSRGGSREHRLRPPRGATDNSPRA
jgi:hypothetical protein